MVSESVLLRKGGDVMAKRAASIVFLLLIFLIPCYAFMVAHAETLPIFPTYQSILDGSFIDSLEDFFTQNLPAQKPLKDFAVDLKVLGGQKEQNDIFLVEDGLVSDLYPPIESYVASNTRQIKEFIDYNNIPTSVMLIPTACAIKQEQMPDFVPLYDQKALIEEIYADFSGAATTVNVYPVLFANRDKYIFYRTDTNLTGLGGYYIYSVLGSRLGQSPRTLEQFDIEYGTQDYYGELYDSFPSNKVRGDILSYYRFTRFTRAYQVTHYDALGNCKVYYNLFPKHFTDLEQPFDSILGGISPMIKIDISSPYSDKLLIFADKTVTSYLPFLALHYKNITVVDLFQADDALLDTLDLEQFDQVLCAYSVETYMHTNTPSMVKKFVQDGQELEN